MGRDGRRGRTVQGDALKACEGREGSKPNSAGVSFKDGDEPATTTEEASKR